MAEVAEKSIEKKRWQHAKNHIMAEKVVIDAIKEERERKLRTKKFKKACVKFTKFFLSTAGLFILNIGVLFLGAFIFNSLELTNEIEGCHNSRNDYMEAENATLILLMDMAQRMDGIGSMTAQGKKEVVDEFQSYLQSFALSVLDTGYSVDLDCEKLANGDDTDTEPDWSFRGSLIFAVTVTTTIGYGAIAPGTKWGRLVCIAYAVIGIPIFMIFLAKIGEVLADLFRITYSTVCCCGCCRKNEKEKTAEEEEEEEAYIQKHAQVWRIDPETGRPIPPSDDDAIEEEEDDEDEEEEEEEEEELTVPLTISILTLFLTIFIGAFIFEAFEEDWNLLDSVYFCAITATTIGFGDMVPTTSLTGEGLIKMLAMIMYITISMAGFSMCFQLMADEIVAKFQWMGEKIGAKKSETAEEGGAEKDDVENGSSDEKKTIL